MNVERFKTEPNEKMVLLKFFLKNGDQFITGTVGESFAKRVILSLSQFNPHADFGAFFIEGEWMVFKASVEAAVILGT